MWRRVVAQGAEGASVVRGTWAIFGEKVVRTVGADSRWAGAGFAGKSCNTAKSCVADVRLRSTSPDRPIRQRGPRQLRQVWSACPVLATLQV